ncbi:MAG: hypothetical protein ACKVS9_17935 [Phycisphaerae bacterium]
MTVTRTITVERRPDRTKSLRVVEADELPPPPPGRIPRVARLAALAIHLDDLLRRGEFATQRELAAALHITQPRLTQILNLTHLAPDLVEALLFLPRTERGRDPITERDLRHIVAMIDWKSQRAAFNRLTTNRIA